MVEDFLKSIQSNVGERLASPILGSFAVAWCLINYKFLVILFSDASITGTFNLIKDVSFPNWRARLLNGFLYPAIASAAYIFIYPYPEKTVYRFRRKKQKEVNDIRLEIEGSILLTLEESRQLRSGFKKRELELEQEIDRLAADLVEIRKEAMAATTSNASTDKAVQVEPIVNDADLETTQYAILRILHASHGYEDKVNIVKLLGQSTVRAEYDLDELVRRKLIEKHFDSDSMTTTFEFTQEGRRVVLDLLKRS